MLKLIYTKILVILLFIGSCNSNPPDLPLKKNEISGELENLILAYFDTLQSYSDFRLRDISDNLFLGRFFVREGETYFTIHAQALNGTIEGAATMAPLAAIAPQLNGVGVNVRLYPNAKGVGMNVTKNGQRVIGFEWHQFKVGGKKTGTMVNRPHIDAPFNGMHHWPW